MKIKESPEDGQSNESGNGKVVVIDDGSSELAGLLKHENRSKVRVGPVVDCTADTAYDECQKLIERNINTREECNNQSSIRSNNGGNENYMPLNHLHFANNTSTNFRTTIMATTVGTSFIKPRPSIASRILLVMMLLIVLFVTPPILFLLLIPRIRI